MKRLQKDLCGAAALACALLIGANAFAGPAAAAANAKTKAGAKAGAKAGVQAKAPAAPAAAPVVPAAPASPEVFAIVGDTVITYDDYAVAFTAAARNKFYHGKAPDNEIAALQRDVAERLVARVLLLREAKQRGMQPDPAEIQKTIDGYDKRYGNSEPWKSNREKLIPSLVARLEEENLLAQIEQAARTVAKPTEQEVRAYYESNPAKFTEPEQIRVSVILRRVPPSSASDVWVKAFDEAQEIHKRLQAGGDFEAEARAHSAEGSASKGGDLGYLHAGMLPEGTESIVQALKVGELTAPMQILEGIAIFKLTARKEAKLNSFEAVQGRAQDLLQRDKGELAWNKLVAELKEKTPTKVDQSRFLPLAAQSGAGASAK